MRTFFEGLLSFLSPCMLPLLPVYLAYFATGEAGRAKTAVRALFFMLGFTAVFVTLGVIAGSAGEALSAHRREIEVVCGIIVMVIALSFFGVFRLPSLGGNKAVEVRGVFSAFLFGIIFSLCLSPCVGAFLAAALLEAASEGGALSGGAKLAAYSAGLGVPMVLSALLLDKAKVALGFLRARMRLINFVCGAVLFVFGLSIALPENMFFSSEKSPAPGAETGGVEVSEKPAPHKGIVNIDGKDQFEKEVLLSQGDVLVDFWAPWCGPCRRMNPILEELAASGVVKVVKVNIDDNRELAAEYRVRSIPSFKMFRAGKVVREVVGSLPRADFERAFGITSAGSAKEP